MVYIRRETTGQCKHRVPRKKYSVGNLIYVGNGLKMLNFRQTQLPNQNSSQLLYPYRNIKSLHPVSEKERLFEREGKFETLTLQVLPLTFMQNKPLNFTELTMYPARYQAECRKITIRDERSKVQRKHNHIW